MDGTTEHVELARAESERGELVLRERRPETGPVSLELRANGVFVMDTVEVSSERAMATAALALVEDPRAVVVGGLGLGYTMHEVLADSRVERCAVVEIEPALVDWMRSGLVPHGPALLADERVSVVVADVAVALAEARPATYDLVLLDVDNGPGYLVHEANAALYEAPALTAARAVLRPGGALVVWSAAEAPALLEALRAGRFGAWLPTTSSGPSTTPWARCRCPATRCGGLRPSARSRTSRSAAPRSSPR
jgi:spermidine synthase